jgi:Fic family protein
VKLPTIPPTLPTVGRTLDNERFSIVLAHSRPVDPKGRYLHWDEMLRRTPPADLTHEEWWLATKYARMVISKQLPLRTTGGIHPTYANTDEIQERVHKLDQHASGQLAADEVVTSLRSSDRYLVSSLVEEAITSSQLEGASTTRREAKEMLASGRRPRTKDEQMIANNFRAMVFAQELAESHDLTVEAVLDLHRIVTENTLDDPADAGRLQDDDAKRIAVWWHEEQKGTETLVHRPPPVAELPQRLEQMVAFANGATPDGFLHPVVRAIVLHYWLAYDHPFVDGNGRTARALFYWCMLRNGYWLAQYLSISSILKKAPSKYARSYLKVSSDDNDVTYFIDYQLTVIERSMTSLSAYLARKMKETKEITDLLHGSNDLNLRQIGILGDALRDSGEQFTITPQSRRYKVTYETARSDLMGLEELGLLERTKRGKKYVFLPVHDLAPKLRQIGKK